MSSVVEFKNVYKSFQIWHDRPHSIKTLMAQAITFRVNLGRREYVEVLNDISMEIHSGDFVGIMGRNGVGKSTLLKLISQIYFPTQGTLKIRGRIVPLLELGAGFASELTGYENIFLNASIVGFSRKEVQEHLKSIIEFSELGEDLYKPVRNYSSGMLVRLGFSIAAHLDAQVLLFDEVLAVGDVGFQNKCYTKIRQLHEKGKTIVLVTHSPEQVEAFCNRCIVIDRKGVVYDGPPEAGAATYRSFFTPP